MPNESESVVAQQVETSADVNLVLAHLREQAGELFQRNAVQSAIIDTQRAEIAQLKSVIDDLSRDLPKDQPSARLNNSNRKKK